MDWSGIAHSHQVLVATGEELQQDVLRVVRVLVLVDHHVAERLRPVVARLREPLEDVDGQHEHVVEVDGVRAEEATLIELVHVGDGLVVEARDPRRVLAGADQLVLRIRDLRVDAARDEPLRIALELLEARLDEPHLVGLVVDREVRAVPEALRLTAQDASAGGVERHQPDRACDAADGAFDALLHLAGRLVREGDREDLVRLHAVRSEQVADAVCENTRLPRAGSGDHEQRAFGRQHRLSLGRIQVGEGGLRLDGGHSSRVAIRPVERARCPGTPRPLRARPDQPI